MTKLERIITEEILDNLEDYDGCYVRDIPCEMYNTDYYIIGRHEAQEFIKEHLNDVLQALDYYQDNMGVQYPYIKDTEKLASLAVYMIAEYIWVGLDTVSNYSDSIVCDVIEEIKEELEELLQQN